MARRSQRRVPKATRDDEYRLLLEHASDELYRDLFIVMRWAGLRVAEAVRLKWDSVDLAQLQMTVTGKGDVERAVDILPEAERMLRRRLAIVATTSSDANASPMPYVFPKLDGEPLTTRAVQRVMQRIRERLGLSRDRFTPHKLRHRYATSALDDGMGLHVLRDQLGHASIQTTSIYLHSQPGQARRVYEKRGLIHWLRKQARRYFEGVD